MKKKKYNNIFTLPSTLPFLPSFTKALLNGEIIKNFAKKDDIQKALSETTIYVPTRRSERALRLCFLDYHKEHASFLPKIIPIGESDDDIDFFTQSSQIDAVNIPLLSDIERICGLAKLILPWQKNLPNHLIELYGNEDMQISSTTASALWLAQDLAKLIDEVETEGGNWEKLQDIAKDDIAKWWQVTLDFLQIIKDYCPQLLHDKIPISKAALRNLTLEQAANHYKKNPNKPVILAGSNGSIKAVAQFMKIITKLENGAVILPHLDLAMDETQWQSLDNATKDIGLFGHPQQSLKALLTHLEISRQDIIEIGKPDIKKSKRAKIVSEALRPAKSSDSWVALKRENYAELCQDFSLIEAANEREEALSIAIALRLAIENPKKTAALVTSNRHLARRVVVELKRFGIDANDSGSIPLAQTMPANLLRLLLAFMFNPSDIVVLLSLLKHPLVHFTHLGKEKHTILEYYELYLLRGCVLRIDLDNFDSFIKERIQIFAKNEKIIIANKEEIATKLLDIQNQFILAITPLKELIQTQQFVKLQDITLATQKALETLIMLDENANNFYQHDEAFKNLGQLLHDLIHEYSALQFKIEEYPQILQAFMALRSVNPEAGGHPRLFIWGLLESRLQSVDTIIIGDLNEGSLPSKNRNDPFMSRPMKLSLALFPPEKHIGLAAHDFQSLTSCDKVIFSRALRRDNAPSVASRWLQRLETVMGEEESQNMRNRGAVFVHFAKTLDKQELVNFISQPCPTPPTAARPKKFSVTEIETLRRDPYAIYAKKILNLKPLDALIHDPSAAERGILYHAIMADLVIKKINIHSQTALKDFHLLAKEHFLEFHLPEDIEALWWPRFLFLAPAIIAYEQSLGQCQRLVEISAHPIEIAKTGVTLSGRADRLNIIQNSAEIIDYKTSSEPSKKQAVSLIAPQLALEAALLERNAFEAALLERNGLEQCQNIIPTKLIYMRLKDKGAWQKEDICEKSGKSVVELANIAWHQLTLLIEHYQKPQNGYLSRAMPKIVNYEGDYDHLARVAEWSTIHAETTDMGDDI